MDSEDEGKVVVVSEVIPPFRIRYNDMDIKLVHDVVRQAEKLFQKPDLLEKDIAVDLVNYVKSKQEFKIGDGQWQCIIGLNFGCSLTFDSHVLTFFDLMGSVRKSVLLFKSG